ncbi:MAG: arsenite methyltransferase [Phycisphaera sp.]|nr:arsenite methyltransferase [Phycisphaera sp.]
MACCHGPSQHDKNPGANKTSCCGQGHSHNHSHDHSHSDTPTHAHSVRDAVREGYSRISESGSLATVTSPDGGGCCGSHKGKAGWTHEQLAAQLGYSTEQLHALPDGANMGLSCGNPGAIAQLKPGEVVLDLGSGGGFDCFLAGPKVGPTGRVIGVDMTPGMLSKARHNLAHYQQTTGLDNVEFRLGEIENLPLADASVDVVISNCVINLSDDKLRVWSEVARVLKPGGRVAASDMALLQPLPEKVRQMVAALVGCVAGAVGVDAYQRMVEEAGLSDVVLTPKPDYVEALVRCDDPLYKQIAAHLPGGASVADYVTSLDVRATRPRSTCGCCKK